MWQAGLVFVGLTGLPHPDQMRSLAESLMSALNINLDETQDQDPFGMGQQHPQMQIHSTITANQIAMAAAGALLLILICFFTPQIIFACLYNSNVHEKKKKIAEGDRTMQSGNFHHGLLACHENFAECMCSAMCPTVRYADTYGSINGSFFGSLCTFIAVNTLIQLVPSFLMAYLMSAAPGLTTDQLAAHNNMNAQLALALSMTCRGLFFGLWGRGHLRSKLGDPEPGSKKPMDCIAWAFCSCCALTQDSVEVDIAVDVTVGCPCSVTPGRLDQRPMRAREVAPSDYEALLLEGGR